MASNRLKEDDMAKPRKFGWLFLLLLIVALSAPKALPAASTANPAIVLAAFGTTTEAFDTYNHFETKVRERFPDHEIRWAFTSHKVRHKVAKEKGKKLNDLGTTLRELKAAGYTRLAIQSLHIVPGEEWDKKVVQASREVHSGSVERTNPGSTASTSSRLNQRVGKPWAVKASACCSARVW